MATRQSSGRPWLWPLLAVGIGAVVLAATIYLTSRKDFSNLDNGLLQFIFFGVGIGASYFFGRRSVAAAAQELLRRDGTKAVRRIVNLVEGIRSLSIGLQQASTFVEGTREDDGRVSAHVVAGSFEFLNIQIEGQLRTAADAIDDWRDIVPQAVKEIEDRAREAQEGGLANGD